MPFGLGIWEIVIFAVVIMLLFGAKGIPQMARRLGTGMREVKDAVAEVDPRKALDPPDEQPRATRQQQQQQPPRQATPQQPSQPEPAEPVEPSRPPAA